VVEKLAGISHADFPFWGFPTRGFHIQSFLRSETHACHVNFALFLSYFNENWNMSANFSNTPQYKI
jgi:hypothetical protein